VAAALNVLLPPSLGLSYLEVLAIFMASIVVGLMSHVPGSLGVFESAVILLIGPAEDQVLPLLGALLAFRACYYLLPLACGVLLFAGYELVRWRRALSHRLARLTHIAPPVTAALVAVSGLLLVLATATPIPPARAERLAAALPPVLVGLGNPLCSGLGVGLLVLARGLMLRAARAWRWGVPMLVLGSLVTLATAERLMVWLPLILALAVLVVARREFVRPPPPFATWMTPAWLAFCGIGLVFAALLLVRG
jgi:phosphatidylglycerol lysyltransferase